MTINSIDMHDIWQLQDECFANNSLDMYQQSAGKSAFYPGKNTPLGLMYLALKLNGEAGELAEHIGKAMRDDDFGYIPLTPERKALVVKELGDVLWYVARIAGELNIKFSDIALGNLYKLFRRTESGTLQGSGDDR